MKKNGVHDGARESFFGHHLFFVARFECKSVGVTEGVVELPDMGLVE